MIKIRNISGPVRAGVACHTGHVMGDRPDLEQLRSAADPCAADVAPGPTAAQVGTKIAEMSDRGASSPPSGVAAAAPRSWARGTLRSVTVAAAAGALLGLVGLLSAAGVAGALLAGESDRDASGE